MQITGKEDTHTHTENTVCNVRKNKPYTKLKSNFSNPIDGQLY